eukprot:jgi/Ulvmu1/9076/UM005_0171.1
MRGTGEDRSKPASRHTPTLHPYQVVLSRYRQPGSKAGRCHDDWHQLAAYVAPHDDGPLTTTDITSSQGHGCQTVQEQRTSASSAEAAMASHAAPLPHRPKPVDLASALEKALRVCTDVRPNRSQQAAHQRHHHGLQPAPAAANPSASRSARLQDALLTGPRAVSPQSPNASHPPRAGQLQRTCQHEAQGRSSAQRPVEVGRLSAQPLGPPHEAVSSMHTSAASRSQHPPSKPASPYASPTDTKARLRRSQHSWEEVHRGSACSGARSAARSVEPDAADPAAQGQPSAHRQDKYGHASLHSAAARTAGSTTVAAAEAAAARGPGGVGSGGTEWPSAVRLRSKQASAGAAVGSGGAERRGGNVWAAPRRPGAAAPAARSSGSNRRAAWLQAARQGGERAAALQPLCFDTEGVAVVAEAGELPEWVALEEEAVDARCAGVSLLEYMDSIACEDLSDAGEAGPAAQRPPSARWHRAGLGDEQAVEETGGGVSSTVGGAWGDASPAPHPTQHADTPAEPGRLSGSTRQAAPAPVPLASWFSNLPDIELRPGTALVPGQQSTQAGGRALRDPALAVTHVSLADMHPTLFTPQADGAADAPTRPIQSIGASAHQNDLDRAGRLKATAAVDMDNADPSGHVWPGALEVGRGPSNGDAEGPRPGTPLRLVKSARPVSPNEPVLDPSVWSRQALERPPSRQKRPPEALHLFEGAGMWKGTAGVKGRPQTAMGLTCSHRAPLFAPAPVSLGAHRSGSVGCRPISRHRPPPESLDLTQQIRF